METSSYALEVYDLKKAYGEGEFTYHALRGVTTKVGKGELISVVGPSGSGKSTLLNLLGTLDRPTAGKVLIDGVDVFSLDDDELARIRNQRIGFVFQSYNLVPRISALRNVELPLMVQQVDGEERRRRAHQMLGAVGLGEKSQRRPNELSGGEQQRVALARALVTNPSIILGDEITGNLDSKTTSEMVSVVKKLNEALEATIILVTHNPEVAKATDRIIYLRDGLIEKEVV